jgi:lipopolysaccharide biosynthesis protein
MNPLHLARGAAMSLVRILRAVRPEPAPVLRVDPAAARVCCLAHVYYDDLWPELAQRIRHFGRIRVDLRVNVAARPGAEETAAKVREDFPEALVRISPNRGRDIGGFFALMRNLDFDRYDLICLLHTKKSPHLPDAVGRGWRSDLLDAILADGATAAINVGRMLQDQSIGVVASARWRRTGIGLNHRRYRDYLDRLAISKKNRRCEFVAGTMMFVRPRVLKTLFLALADVEFEQYEGRPLETQLDGEAMHAIERVLGNVVRELGLRFAWV